MKYIKTYEGVFDFIQKRRERIKEKNLQFDKNNAIIDELLNSDIDENKIRIKKSKGYHRIDYEKNGVEYTIVYRYSTSSEFGPTSSMKFFINNERIKYENKSDDLFNFLNKKYKEYQGTLDKYNL